MANRLTKGKALVGGISHPDGTHTVGGVRSHREQMTAAFSLVAATTAGGVAAVANPAGAPIIVERVILDIANATPSACSLDTGIAANGTTKATGLMASLDAAVTAASTSSAVAKMGATQYLTVSANGTPTGLAGNGYLIYIRA